MQLQREHHPNQNAITAYGDDYIEINLVRYVNSIYFLPEGDVHPLALRSAQEITSDELDRITGLDQIQRSPMDFLDDVQPSKPEHAPELIVLGTGHKQQFLHPAVTQRLLSMGIGVEIMDSQAAARTYNILMSEGRKVLAILIQENP
ncbi:Mth938-like domain-containing protein [Alcaligenes endophyticus]|uniref:MTH938/NDUFAF3 family protein n=1 Tax=Alcaligenes endophyticus TaxID=1929088 RepID=A0ABT8ENA6_9BURK|nr:MTH938/NDUFAF3 family protein [Alcaligenes endophyticus]MCX5591325.1 MTH938/NDUFAF3 family protein [Alcaligenes endophyticus]MDN4122794.1 MTH938/NDUFAF3 family protein [Alcaligenes endophyticus]